MDDILTFLVAYRYAISAILILLATTIIIIRWWDDVKLFYKSMYYSLPAIGKNARLAKNTSLTGNGWYQAEKTLCEDFYADIQDFAADPEMYDKSKAYLSKVHENGRKKLSIFMMLIIIGLVFVESLGFAYILSGYTLPGASENLQVKGAIGISFLISAVLVWLTHSSGAEMHKRGLIKKARAWWNHDQSADRPALKPIGHVTLETNEEDDDCPQYIQIVNRVDTNANVTPGMPVWSILAFVAIVSIAVGATVVRYETYKQERVAETLMEDSGTTEFSLSLLEDSSESDLPSEITAPQNEADQKAEEEASNSEDTANFTTFSILAFLFILIQIMGIGIGQRYGFAGKESKQAYQLVGRFKSRTEYEAWFERKKDAISMIAQKHLTNLQTSLRNYTQNTGINEADRAAHLSAGERTFEEFYYQKQNKSDEIKERQVQKKEAIAEPVAPVTKVQPEPVQLIAETAEEMEARLRAEILAEKEAQERKPETEEEMRERLRKELMADQG
ncbi:hypothetical protein [Curvivirga aplysinae]|uniref:hypothetical protein n=1 Tax=Curvivirga aplysinae TaxID=2529852 RepID=UPI0012BBC5FE|nr:hypothetical protein [Curvivirga aplysinae]MTI08779.1 hypothetical protein [Curvivirga aplysinae]